MEVIIRGPERIDFRDEKEKRWLSKLFQTIGVNPRINGSSLEIPKEIHIVYPEHTTERKKIKDRTHSLIKHLEEVGINIKVEFKEMNSSPSTIYLNKRYSHYPH